MSPEQEWEAHIGRAAKWVERWVRRWDAYGEYYPDGRQQTAKDFLSKHRLFGHFAGWGNRIGLHVSSPDGMGCQCIIDIDAHDAAQPENLPVALAVAEWALTVGVRPILEDSNGRGGYHLRLWLDRDRPIAQLRAFGNWLLRDHPGHEVFPKQDRQTNYGHYVRLPGKHHKRAHWSRFWDFESSRWEGAGFLLACQPQSTQAVPREAWSYRAELQRFEDGERDRRKAVGLVKSLIPNLGGRTGRRPSELFDENHSWEEILEPHGWTLRHRRGEVGYWSRPGVSHVSATTDHVPGRLHVFSSAAEPLESGKTYTKFGALAVLEHGGDWSAAARHCSGVAGKETVE